MFGLRIPERRGDLAPGFGPDERGDLGLDADGGQAGAGPGVEEVDGAVVGAAAGGEEAALPGAEGDCFYGGGVEPSVAFAAGGDAVGGAGRDDAVLGGWFDVVVRGWFVVVIVIQ